MNLHLIQDRENVYFCNMLNRVFIQNFALIDVLEINFHHGMQVITGETGAGKSIILGALRLILGERADSKNISQADKKSVIEVEFSLSSDFVSIFEELDIDFIKDTIIRREILPTGKSRAFVNDTPITLENLKKITEKLIDIHSQFETEKLFTEEYQFSILDGIASNNEKLIEYQKIFQLYQEEKKTLQKLEKSLQEGNQENDYKKFLWQELEQLNLESIDWENLQAQLSVQENAELITEQLGWILERLDADEIGVIDGLHHIKNKLQKINEISPIYSELSDRIESCFIELKDCQQALQDETERVDIDANLKIELQSKYNAIQALLLKHNTQDIQELIKIKNALYTEQNDIENLEQKIIDTKNKIKEHEKSLSEKAIILSQKRQKAATIFKEKIESLLCQMGLEKAKIMAQLTPTTHYNRLGNEEVNILFQANTGFPMKPIQNAVSGGERSRVMLAVKKVMAEYNELPTLILDEIDTGVSGKVAEEIGKVMREMSQNMQLIVISHLAQVAAKGNDNYKVIKYEKDGITRSNIIALSEEEKLQEIAQLLSGSSITPAALEQAKSLIGTV